MDFPTFSESLSQALAVLEEIRRREVPDSLFFWADAANQAALPKAGTVFIGRGRYPDGADPTRVDYLVLNNKSASFWGKPSWSSITKMMGDFDAERWNAVRATLRLSGETTPSAFFQDRTIVVEDASPDCVFSFYVLLLKLADVEENVPDASFGEGVDLWELGHTSFPGKFTELWPLLQAALSHQYFDEEPRDGRSGLNEAWIRSLRLLHHAVEKRYSVNSIRDDVFFTELHMARSAVESERQHYANARQRSETLQLLVPLRGVKGRGKLVDAFFLEEEISLGIAKVYLRNDVENSYLGRGYGLLVMNREKEVGTGNELTVSADAREGLDLTDLWIDLERREWARRPDRLSDEPRNLAWLEPVYQREKIEKANQPWYINDHFDLIAAPRPDRAPSGGVKEEESKLESGTRLSWSDLRDGVWKIYNPARNILVTELDVEASISGAAYSAKGGTTFSSGPLIVFKPQAGAAPGKRQGKRLRLFSYDPADKGRSFLVTPTMERIFAALILTDDRRVGIDDLPEADSFDFMPIPGCFVVVHEAGALAFNDWNRTQMDIPAVTVEFKKAAERYELVKGRSETEDAAPASPTAIEESIEAGIRKLRGRTRYGRSSATASSISVSRSA